jgi:antitoxin HicB
MVRTPYSYGAILVKGEDGRFMAYFPELPEAVTDGADEAEALAEAADCLSEALASRIVDGEEIPPAIEPGQYSVSPDLTVALKVALYSALRQRDMTVADLADLLDMGDWHQAARLIDPKRSTKLTTLIDALDALGCQVEIGIRDDFVPEDIRGEDDRLSRTTPRLGLHIAERPTTASESPPAERRSATPTSPARSRKMKLK